MADEKTEKAYKDWIENEVGFDIDWDDPPGPAYIALQSLLSNHDTEGERVISESIDDISRTFESQDQFFKSVMKPLYSIRKLKW